MAVCEVVVVVVIVVVDEVVPEVLPIVGSFMSILTFTPPMLMPTATPFEGWLVLTPVVVV